MPLIPSFGGGGLTTPPTFGGSIPGIGGGAGTGAGTTGGINNTALLTALIGAGGSVASGLIGANAAGNASAQQIAGANAASLLAQNAAGLAQPAILDRANQVANSAITAGGEAAANMGTAGWNAIQWAQEHTDEANAGLNPYARRSEEHTSELQ